MDSTQAPITGENGGKLPHTRFLRPPWPKGVSGNPAGRAADGGGSKDHPIRATLRKRLAKRRALQRFVDTWINAACSGDSAAREQILKRLDPVLDDPAAGRTVLEGLRLELTHRGATLSMGRLERPAAGQELGGSSVIGVPEGGLVAPQIGLDDPSVSTSEGTQVTLIPDQLASRGPARGTSQESHLLQQSQESLVLPMPEVLLDGFTPQSLPRPEQG